MATALALACADLAACDEPESPSVDLGDGGVGTAAGVVNVHTESTNVPALVATVRLSLASMQARSDREPSMFPAIPFAAPITLDPDQLVPLAGATPATYGGVRLVALDALTLTSPTNATLVVDFVGVPPIELRCDGPGTYLPPGGQIELTVTLDFAALEDELTSLGYYPLTLPPRTVTNPAQVALLLDALETSLAVSCAP
jgi:hypothetical protein